MRRITGIVGNRYGRLVITSEAPPVIERSGRERAAFEVHCDCGTVKVIRLNTLRSGKSQSCGCAAVERFRQRVTTHGDRAGGSRPSVEYHSWCAMKQRCTNQNVEKWPGYGGRGIKVCDRWLNSFENFLSDMGRKPSPTPPAGACASLTTGICTTPRGR